MITCNLCSATHILHPALYTLCFIWWYEFNNIKSGAVTYGEFKPPHSANMQERSWTLGIENVDKLYKYKNLGVYKNYCDSFDANIDKNILKTLKKVGMIFSPKSTGANLTLSFMSSIGNKSAYPLSYLVPGFSLTPTLLSRLKCCQRWLLNIIFHVPKLPPVFLLKDWLV